MSDKGLTISWEDFAKFIRQLTHDLRNQLNAAELQAALINELTEDGELKGEVKRLRQLVSELGTTLQRLSTAVAPQRPNAITYPAADLVQDLREKIGTTMPALPIHWTVDALGGEAEVDPQQIEYVLLELLDNASRHRAGTEAVEVEVRGSSDSLILVLREKTREPVPNTATWGAEPLRSMTHGHYGLGLRRARAIIEAHGGELRAEYDATTSALVTKICLPLRASS